MQTKSAPDEIQSFLSDASFMRDGYADRVVLPESVEEVAEVLAAANRDRTPVTISGAGTGTVGGRGAFGGIVLATDRLNHIKSIETNEQGAGRGVAEPGVILADFQRAVDQKGLLYPPDPTERGAYLGGTVATNASGARTFKYGPTRNYIERLNVVLATGEILDLRRGGIRLSEIRQISFPTYRPPATRKNATGYFVAPNMDAIDLFIGSEGTLGVICEIETRLVPKPKGLLRGVVFFADEADVLAFVREARTLSARDRSLHRQRRHTRRHLRDRNETRPQATRPPKWFCVLRRRSRRARVRPRSQNAFRTRSISSSAAKAHSASSARSKRDSS